MLTTVFAKDNNTTKLVEQITEELDNIYYALEQIDDSTFIEGWSSIKDIYSTPEDVPNTLLGIGNITAISTASYDFSKYSVNDIERQESKTIGKKLLQVVKSQTKEYIYKSKHALCFVDCTKGFADILVGIYFDEADAYISDLKKLFSGIKKEDLQKVCAKILLYYIESGYEAFPAIYSPDFKVTTNKPGLYKMRDGSILELPKITKSNYDKYIESVAQGKSVYNMIISIDTAAKLIHYIDGSGNPQAFSYIGSLPITPSDLVFILNQTLSYLFSATGSSSLSAVYNWSQYNSELYRKYADSFYRVKSGVLDEAVKEKIGDKDLKFEKTSITVGDVIHSQNQFFNEFLNELENIVSGSTKLSNTQNVLRPFTYLRFIGALHALRECAKDAVELKSSVVKQQLDFEKTDATKLPAISNINPEVNLFPHQAETLAKLNVAGEKAIVDISTGGGKTLTLIYDICNLLGQGKINRPLLVMPAALIGQWISQIQYFTNNTINAFAITTDIIRSRGREELEKIITSAPRNTIFLTTYSFLSTGKYLADAATETYSYEGMEWIRNTVNPDYISLDESHFIKRPTTDYNLSVSLLGDDVKYKRIATGTLINNNPTDLIGQTGFLDPSIVGNPSEFKARYTVNGSWASNFAELCRRDLRNNAKYIMYRKKDWAAVLPKVKYGQYFVDLNPRQAKAYKDMVYQVLDEIRKDPTLSKAWEKLVNNGEDALEIPISLLGKLARLEQYLTAPEVNNLIKELGDDAISPKLPKIDELIEESVKQGYKAIVAVHYRESARHLMTYSKFSDKSVYYDASNKKVVYDFINNPNIVAIFAVQQSLKEGLNLQVANRVIIADVDWTPGNLDQLEARILRPHLSWKDGKIINKNKDKIVYIDTVIANDSADVVKYMFQNFKKLRNAKIMENSPVELIDPPSFSDDALVARAGDPLVGGEVSLERIEEFNAWQLKQIDERRNSGNVDFIKPQVGTNIEGKILDNLPWVSGMTLPTKDGELPLLDYLEDDQDFRVARDLRDVSEDLLANKVVNTEFGYGKIIKASSASKLRIKLFSGKSISYDASLTIIAPDMAEKEAIKLYTKKVNKQKTAPKTNTEIKEEQNEIELPTGVVNRQKLNQLADSFGIVISRKANNDGTFSYRWKLKNESIYTKPLNIESLEDKSWAQWLSSIKSASKAFEKHIEKLKEKEQKEAQNTENAEDNALEMYLGTYNDIPMLVSYTDDPDSSDLLKYGFKLFPKSWEIYIKSRNFGYRLLEKLQQKYEIPQRNLDEIMEVFNNMTRNKYGYDFPADKVRNWVKLSLRKAKKGQLKIYPLIVDGYVYLEVSKIAHPGVNLSNYGFDEIDHFYGYTADSISQLRSKLKQVTKELEVTNIEELRKQAKDYFNIKI